MSSRTLLNAPIRKVTIGDIKLGMTYQKGKDYGKVRISSIIKDENSYFLNGCVTYVIYAVPVGSPEDSQEQVWKSFERQPVIVEYDFDEEL